MGKQGKVTFVGAGPGDPDLITVKGMKALQAADVVLYDSLVERSMLEGLKARLMFVGKRRGKHSMAQEDINGLLVQQARKGEHVVRLKGGDCAVLGRLGEELLHLAEHGVPYEIVPGVTSVTAAPTFAGIPVTHRGLADSFAVVTAHRGEDDKDISVPRYHTSTTIVLMMALTTTEVWQKILLDRDYPPETPVAFVSSGTTPRQKVLITTVGASLEAVKVSGLKSPTLAVVGRVVTLHERLRWFEGGEEGLSPFEQPPGEDTALPLCVEG